MEDNKNDAVATKAETKSKIDYFKLGDAVDDLNLAGDKKDKALAGAKLFGKTLFNVGLFAGKMAAEVMKDLPKHVDRMQGQQVKKIDEQLKSNADLSDEQVAKLKASKEKMQAYRDARKEG
jgi:hypothetical protein